MWELDCEESWAPKNWCFWTVVLEKTLESPLDCKEIQPVHSEDQSWVFFRRNDAKAETPILWPRHAKSWLIGKDSDAGRDWGQEEKGTTEDEMAEWHHRLDGREMDVSLSELWEIVMDREAWRAAIHGATKRWTRATELNWIFQNLEFSFLHKIWKSNNTVLLISKDQGKDGNSCTFLFYNIYSLLTTSLQPSLFIHLVPMGSEKSPLISYYWNTLSDIIRNSVF